MGACISVTLIVVTGTPYSCYWYQNCRFFLSPKKCVVFLCHSGMRLHWVVPGKIHTSPMEEMPTGGGGGGGGRKISF